ncbi:zinc-dependent alcohol dehydrogenase family protein [Oenococcus alcoholitolerans]|uniref:zinc-dependent alcohol dehydrogenase family protein n=1 Tax=Oenococcus alcoholitolerans TaxID=931074 RepID=UPI003F70585B
MVNEKVSTEKIPATMNAWKLDRPGKIDLNDFPLKFKRVPVPKPGDHQILVKVITCGVCRTDLHVISGDLAVHKQNLTPGHQIVGKVVKLGSSSQRFQIGDRVGIPWLRHTCGVCAYCRSGRENLCPYSNYTGWDEDGGYAEYAVAPEAFAYRIPEGFPSNTAAPLLCAGIIGYHAYKQADLPVGGKIGLYGFGGSAHLTAELAIKQGAEVHVFTRGKDAGELALKLGAKSVQNTYAASPVPLDAAIIFAPVGDCVPNALKNIKPGGKVVIAGIHLTDIPSLNYENDIFHEKVLTSVESNTRKDGEEFLTLASRLGIKPKITEYPLEKADQAMYDLSQGDVEGANVLRVSND